MKVLVEILKRKRSFFGRKSMRKERERPNREVNQRRGWAYADRR